MNLKANLSRLALRFADHLFGAIVGLLLVAALAAWGTFFAESARRTLGYAISILSIPTPLWVAICLVLLCVVYIRLRVRRSPSVVPSLDPPPKTVLIEVGRFKWKTDIYSAGEFKTHAAPYCRIHETRLIDYPRLYCCQDFGKDGCTSVIKKTELRVKSDIAHSFIEHKLKERIPG